MQRRDSYRGPKIELGMLDESGGQRAMGERGRRIKGEGRQGCIGFDPGTWASFSGN